MNSFPLVLGVVCCSVAFVTAQEYMGSHCFHFTWLGPHYFPEDIGEVNGTCPPVEFRGDGVPCIEPLVITSGTGRPNMTYILENYSANLTRRRVGNQVCAKYSFYFNNEVTNITYMTTIARFESLHNDGPITSGCYHQTVRGHQVEVCVCQNSGPYGTPCNSATHFNSSLILFGFLLFTLFACIIKLV